VPSLSMQCLIASWRDRAARYREEAKVESMMGAQTLDMCAAEIDTCIADLEAKLGEALPPVLPACKRCGAYGFCDCDLQPGE